RRGLVVPEIVFVGRTRRLRVEAFHRLAPNARTRFDGLVVERVALPVILFVERSLFGFFRGLLHRRWCCLGEPDRRFVPRVIIRRFFGLPFDEEGDFFVGTDRLGFQRHVLRHESERFRFRHFGRRLWIVRRRTRDFDARLFVFVPGERGRG